MFKPLFLRRVHPLKCCPQLAQQCRQRAVHLLYAARTRHPVGNHKILDYQPLKYNEKDYDLKIMLTYREKDINLSRKNIDETKPIPGTEVGLVEMRTTIEEWLKPGYVLMPQVQQESTEERQFIVLPLVIKKPTKKLPKVRDGHPRSVNPQYAGRAEIHMTLPMSQKEFYRRMQSGFWLLQEGKGVEWHIHCPKDPTGKYSLDAFYQSPHVWPHVIAKAMPSGSEIIIKPQTNLNPDPYLKLEVTWAMSLADLDKPFHKNLDRKLEEQRVKQRQHLLERPLATKEQRHRARTLRKIRERLQKVSARTTRLQKKILEAGGETLTFPGPPSNTRDETEYSGTVGGGK